MRKNLKIAILVVFMLFIPVLCGCGISSAGWTVGPISISDYDPPFGYQPPPTGLPLGSLTCMISKPSDNIHVAWDAKLWIFGIIWREGKEINDYPWDGPEWSVDSIRVGANNYWFDQTWPEMYVRFMFDAEVAGPGPHEVTLTAWDQRYEISNPVSDGIRIIVD